MTAEQLKKIRAAKKLNQQEFAKELGVSYSALTKWETNKNPIPQWVADKLRNSSGKFHIEGLTISEAAQLEKIAASKGVTSDAIVAELVRAALKFGVPAIMVAGAIQQIRNR